MEELIKQFIKEKCKVDRVTINGKITNPYALIEQLLFCDIVGDINYHVLARFTATVETTITVTHNTAVIDYHEASDEFTRHWIDIEIDFGHWRIHYDVGGTYNISHVSRIFDKTKAKEIVDYFQRYGYGTLH